MAKFTHKTDVGTRRFDVPDREPPPRIPVVYAVRLPNGVIKIGHTTDLMSRRHRVHPGAVVLGFRLGTREDEQRIHEGLVEHLHHGREWYNPTLDVLAVVNEMRDDLGLDPLAA